MVKIIIRKIAGKIYIGWNKVLCLACMISFLAGCTQVIDLDLKSADSKLVVEGIVTNELKTHFVRLTRSIPYLDSRPTPEVRGATVTISDGSRTISMDESEKFPGYYFSKDSFMGVPGRTYVLKIDDVDIDGDGRMEQYEAASLMPEIGEADSISIDYSQDWELWRILVYAWERPISKDYYMFRVFKNGNLISGSISEYSIVSDKYFDGNYANGMWVQSMDAGEESSPLEKDDVVSLQMASIPEEYYDFIEAVQRENRGQYPLFSGPPANVPGNVNNGALGFFAVYAVTYESKRVDQNILILKNQP